MLGTNFVPRAPSRGATGQAACSRRRQVLLVSGFFILVFVTTLLVLASSDISESCTYFVLVTSVEDTIRGSSSVTYFGLQHPTYFLFLCILLTTVLLDVFIQQNTNLYPRRTRKKTNSAHTRKSKRPPSLRHTRPWLSIPFLSSRLYQTILLVRNPTRIIPFRPLQVIVGEIRQLPSLWRSRKQQPLTLPEAS